MLNFLQESARQLLETEEMRFLTRVAGKSLKDIEKMITSEEHVRQKILMSSWGKGSGMGQAHITNDGGRIGEYWKR